MCFYIYDFDLGDFTGSFYLVDYFLYFKYVVCDIGKGCLRVGYGINMVDIRVLL